MTFKKGMTPWNKDKKTGHLSKNHRRKIGLSQKGKKKQPFSEEHKEKIRQAHLGKKMSEETKIKMSITQKKIRSSVEVRRKMSEASKKSINCGRFKKGQKGWNKGKHFSKEVKRKMSIAKKGKMPKFIPKTRKGKDSYLWKGGITPENKKIRSSAKYFLWREIVFKRDNWVCQKTKEKGYKLEAHHIKNFSEFPELRFEIDNGITLSKKAHTEFHNIYGKVNNTREQLNEFLNIK